MFSRSLLALFVGCAFLLPMIDGQQAVAFDLGWDGGGGTTNWNTAANWEFNFLPNTANDLRAVIGYDKPATPADATVVVSATPASAASGIALGLRERNETTGDFVNADPGPGNLVGRLTVQSGAILTSTQGATSPNFPTDGTVLVGVDGRGELTLNNGTLNARRLTVAGEEYTDPNGALHRSFVDVRGNSTLNVTGISPLGVINLDRDVRVEGPNVNWTSQGRLTMGSTNRYTAAITSATAHSPMKTSNVAVVNGSLNVEFSGAGASGHAFGETWDLVDANFGIAGGFNNLVGFNKEVPVSGLTTPNPVGTGYILQRVPGAGEFQQILQLKYQAYLVLQVNRDTGQMTITNPHGGNIQIDGYTISSARGSMLASYHGINGATPTPLDANWAFPPGNNNVNVLSEVKQPDFTPPINDVPFDLQANPNVPLGVGFSKTGVAANVSNFGLDGEDLVFTYTGPGGVLFEGPVVYSGTKFTNNLVLRVNPSTGNAFLKNDSMETLTFDGYEILSSENSLNWNTWTGITSGGWQKSPAQTPTAEDSLTNTHPTGSATLAPGAQVPIGDIGAFTTQTAQDGLSMNFILKVGIVPIAGDFDEDGDVDGSDFLKWQRDGLGAAALANWEANYGMTGGAPTSELDFRPGTVVFDPTAGVAAIAAVPEPGAGLLMLLGLTALTGRRRRSRAAVMLQSDSSEIRRQSSQVGANTMVRRFACFATVVAALGVVSLLASSAEAVTGGANMTNIRMELPGPVGEKVFAFDPNGVPNGAIPGWTFPGPGVETFGHGDPNEDNFQIGDSGTEGSGGTNPDNELLLSTLDGIAYQNSATAFFPASTLPSTQQYVFSFTAREVFTIGPIDPNTGSFTSVTGQGRNQLSGRITYGDARSTLTTFQHILTGTDTQYQIVLPHNSPLITGSVLGQKVGIEFDNTSIEFDNNPANDPNDAFDVEHAWNHVDDVFLEITGVLTGDLNGNGSVGLDDYTIIRNNQQMSVDYLAQGDLVRDGIVDLRDFRAWTLLPSVISSGVLDLIAAVPEPTSFTLALVMTALASGAARRVGRKHVAVLMLAGICGVMATASKSSAELLVYDPFLLGADPNNGNPAAGEYSLGLLAPSPEPGNAGNQAPIIGPDPNFFDPVWKQNGSPNSVVVAQGLSYLGAPAAGGAMQASDNSRAGRYLTTPWDDTTTGTRYISFMANFGGNETVVGHRMVEFWSAGGTVGDDGTATLRVGYGAFNGPPGGNVPTTARIFMDRNPGADKFIVDNSPLSFAQDTSTHLIVLKFTLSANPNQDIITLFLDPTDAQEEPILPNAQITNQNFTLGAIGGMTSFGVFDNFPRMDELRIATTFTDVMPDLPLPGDCCGGGPVGGAPDSPDDLVDQTDFDVIFANLNRIGVESWEGDVTGDGRVTLADYRLWKDNRTDTGPLVGESSAFVPEPSALGLALLGALAFGRARRRN